MSLILIKMLDNILYLFVDQQNRFFSSGNFRKKTTYPIEVPLKDRYAKTCKNEELIKKGSFIIKKSKSDHKEYDWDFKAFLQKGTPDESLQLLSELNAEDGGYCNEVKTTEGFKQCGMATTLMEFCFTDEDVGGMDLKEDTIFGMQTLEKWRTMATKNCKHVVFLECYPKSRTPIEACSAYLTAAINKGHIMMFTHPNTEQEMDVMNVATFAKPELKKGGLAFIKEHGARWYFCKCKPERIEQCKAMDFE